MINATQIALFQLSDILSRPYDASILEVATRSQTQLATQEPISWRILKKWMTSAFQGSDAQGIWNWKDAWDAVECSIVLFLRQQSPDFLSQPKSALKLIAIAESLIPTHTTRTDSSLKLQQFSTPAQIGYLAAQCAGITSNDVVLEPSAGTGLLAIYAQVAKSKLVLNELDSRRSLLLRKLFPGNTVSNYNAEQIHDYLAPSIQPTIVLMNPPFSTSPDVDRRNPIAIAKHVRSAFLRLVPGGRMVLIAAHWFHPGSELWEDCFRDLPTVQVRLNASVPETAYAKHGVHVATRLLVVDKVLPDHSPTLAIDLNFRTEQASHQGRDHKIKTFKPEDLEQLRQIPARSQPEFTPIETGSQSRKKRTAVAVKVRDSFPSSVSAFDPNTVVQIEYDIRKKPPITSGNGEIYETYAPKRIAIRQATPHPSLLCESIALASVSPPVPSYIPQLPQAAIAQNVLSEAQLETLIYAGQAHSEYLRGHYIVEENWDKITTATRGTRGAVQFRKGFFLADSTGCGKGRQVAGIIADNWIQGRTRALWISKTESLIEATRRDWCALGGQGSDIVSLSKFKSDQALPTQGILFTTYATLRSGGKQGQPSRLEQILKWAGTDFDGVIAFDEAHALANAVAENEFGAKTSLQGITGLRLQRALPDARILYVSATGATKVASLAYAERLGLWKTGEFPFASQADFVAAIEDGGVAAMEVVARDLKALGLYFARNLSFEGVDYQTLEAPLTPEQIKIYDTYAEAFMIIHTHLDDALKACNVVSYKNKTLNSEAKRAARGVFESCKQRFFDSLLCSMKCPTLIRSIESDLERNECAVIQLVSTGEELMERRLAEIPVEEWSDLHCDLTPREYVLHYLERAFPVQLYEVYTGLDGEQKSRLVKDNDGNPILSQEALSKRQALIERICRLPSLPSALDLLLHHFGHESVAEVTGRSRRILCEQATGRLYVSSRPAKSNLLEISAFQSNEKRILVFSDAGNTGESYHSSWSAKNISRRNHYLLQAGWRADAAIQGLGRTHRTNQACAPLFRPVVTNVRGERRFISTIARRLDALGSLTKGQRQTGGQGLFKQSDNLESFYAIAALKTFFVHLCQGKVSECSLEQFQAATGLILLTQEGRLKDALPPMPTFLNRMLALPISLQNSLFAHFELLMDANIEAAQQSGQFDHGIATLNAERLKLIQSQVVYEHPTGGQTHAIEIEKLERNVIRSSDSAQRLGTFIVHPQKEIAAITRSAPSTINLETGAITERIELVQPCKTKRMSVAEFQQSPWVKADLTTWKSYWDREVEAQPEFLSSRLFMISGLLLPIWHHLESENMQVYRVATDTGERFLGRLVNAAHMKSLSESLGLHQVRLSADEIYTLCLDQEKKLEIAPGLAVRSRIVRGDKRLEIIGRVSEAIAEQILSAGCFSEIIDWQLRYFIPVDSQAGPRTISAIQELF